MLVCIQRLSSAVFLCQHEPLVWATRMAVLPSAPLKAAPSAAQPVKNTAGGSARCTAARAPVRAHRPCCMGSLRHPRLQVRAQGWGAHQSPAAASGTAALRGAQPGNGEHLQQAVTCDRSCGKPCAVEMDPVQTLLSPAGVLRRGRQKGARQ